MCLHQGGCVTSAACDCGHFSVVLETGLGIKEEHWRERKPVEAAGNRDRWFNPVLSVKEASVPALCPAASASTRFPRTALPGKEQLLFIPHPTHRHTHILVSPQQPCKAVWAVDHRNLLWGWKDIWLQEAQLLSSCDHQLFQKPDSKEDEEESRGSSDPLAVKQQGSCRTWRQRVRKEKGTLCS